MFSKELISKTLFLDIETVSISPDFSNLDDRLKDHWIRKSAGLKSENTEEVTPESLFSEKAGIFAEFGKIICISCGFLSFSGNDCRIKIKSFYNDDEKMLLSEFANMLDNWFDPNTNFLCAHNGKEFDFPYLSRRMLVNRISLPKGLRELVNAKPWDVRHLDTMMLWKFGDYKAYTSLDLLSAIFGLPTPKDDISGAQVGSVYWKEKDLERVVKYCEKDVKACADLLLAYSGFQPSESY